MREKLKHVLRRLHPVRLSELLRLYIRDESIGGKLVIAAAILSLIAVNSPLGAEFTNFWRQSFSIGLGDLRLDMPLIEWINEGAMALFFLVVGLEIKREFTRGELKDRKAAILPIGAAIGGMIVPAVLYLAFNLGSSAVHGWGIPIATDTAIALAVLALLGRRVPVSLKIFLLAAVVTDDVLAIATIGLFYSHNVDAVFLLSSIAVIAIIYIFRAFLSSRLSIVISLGVLLWLVAHFAGIHASIVGVIMGLLAPVPKLPGLPSDAERIERLFLPITTLVIVPVFALANAGFVLSYEAFSDHPNVVWGVVAGLTLGKVIGFMIACVVMVKLKLAQLPYGTKWSHMIGVGFIAGIGFTVSLFITELAFADGSPYTESAKMGIFIASTISAVVGLFILRLSHRSVTQ